MADIREAFDSRLTPWTPGCMHWLCLVVRDNASQTPLGVTGYKHHEADCAEVGFLFAPAAQGKGYGFESLQALCDYAFHRGGSAASPPPSRQGISPPGVCWKKPASGWRVSCVRAITLAAAGIMTGYSVYYSATIWKISAEQRPFGGYVSCRISSTVASERGKYHVEAIFCCR